MERYSTVAAQSGKLRVWEHGNWAAITNWIFLFEIGYYQISTADHVYTAPANTFSFCDVTGECVTIVALVERTL